MQRQLHGIWLGRRDYDEVHGMQQALQAARVAGRIPDTVLFVEHEPVITLGRGGKSENLLLSPEMLRARGVKVIETGRGGDVTLHAPGQLVMYPIVDLSPDRRDVRRYVGDLTETMRRLALDFGIEGGPVDGLIGLWVNADLPAHWTGAGRLSKLGAIGVRISRWVTMHGLAFNLRTDHGQFAWIVPCGIREHGVTSVLELTGDAPEVASVVPRAFEVFADVIGGTVVGLEDRVTGPLEAAPRELEARPG
jgi:lipoyl(octanoyl) transferase